MANDSPTCQFAKCHSPKIRQRFANLSDSPNIRQKLFANDSPTCQFPKSHSPKIRQIVANDSPTCQFAKCHSPNIRQWPKIRQRVSSPKTIRQRFAKTVPQKPFPKIRQIVAIRQRDSPTCQFAKNSPNIRQRFANVSVPQKPFAKDSPNSQFKRKIRQISSPKDSPNIRQMSSSPNIRQIFANDSPTCQFPKTIRQRFAKDSPKAIRQRFAK